MLKLPQCPETNGSKSELVVVVAAASAAAAALKREKVQEKK